jgi:hypothetical protein
MDDGSAIYEKHKIFFYRQDYDKLIEALGECFGKIKEMHGNAPEELHGERTQDADHSKANDQDRDQSSGSSFTDVNFEDLK